MTKSSHCSIIAKNRTSLRLKNITLDVISLGKKNNMEQPRQNLNSWQLSYRMKLEFLFIPYTLDQR